MNIRTEIHNGVELALIDSDEMLIVDVPSALDLMATVWHQSGSNRMVLDKSAIHEDFFELRSGLAGEIIQKFINYRMKVAIVGDFSVYSSKSLKDFIYECNKGNDLFFLPTERQAIEKLSQ
ncbi:DUF4180 domain-containing protein [Cohnella zeiphila]|uniref:DUF4180 domain-containing protein n=1 Tax=Cohnella zeiphila TaxID=2761120 RepID=A0A7X0SRI8_9BACL|nr:DUF4180 domain-containing protein [Cohnella zeiphila]MBB6733605.1 DUF4180 domain-containing protein [Cohnella zeiphila]